MRVLYWTECCLEPKIEAISKEVCQLAHHFKKSWIYGISPHYTARWSRADRYFGLHPVFHPLLRVGIPFLERFADINHVYGGVCPWVFYKSLKTKPLVLTIADQKGEPNFDFLERCRKIIVQTETYYKQVLGWGIEARKVELLYPGLQLDHFRPMRRDRSQGGPPRILFASAPRSVEEMEGRGVHLLLETARRSPASHYSLLYREWAAGYTSLEPTRQAIARQDLRNVNLMNRTVGDMAEVYGQHEFVVIPYTRADGGKECPNSLIEGLACGLPALISTVCPFASFIETHACGVVFEPTPEGLQQAIETGRSRYLELSENAAQTSRRFFSEANLLKRMAGIYQEALGGSA
jgi:glycosyltransferase involved in cell wall biosynthesis